MSATARYQWTDLPASLRQAIEEQLGGPVLSAAGKSGGFTAGMASVLTTASTSVFVKALPIDNDQVASYQREAVFVKALPLEVPSPSLRFDFEAHGWIVLGFQAIEGSTLSPAPSQQEAEEVVGLIDTMSAKLTPSPVPDLPRLEERVVFRHWQNLAATGVSGALHVADLPAQIRPLVHRFAEIEARFGSVRGQSMVHLDVRHDNLIRRASDDKIFLVDWSWPVIGPSWTDAASYLATCRGSFDREAALQLHIQAAGSDPADIDSFLVGLTGHWLAKAREASPVHAPHLREYQSASAHTTLAWLDQRGWNPRWCGLLSVRAGVKKPPALRTQGACP